MIALFLLGCSMDPWLAFKARPVRRADWPAGGAVSNRIRQIIAVNPAARHHPWS